MRAGEHAIFAEPHHKHIDIKRRFGAKKVKGCVYLHHRGLTRGQRLQHTHIKGCADRGGGGIAKHMGEHAFVADVDLGLN